MKFRYFYIIFGCLLALSLLILTDPDAALVTNMPFGASTAITLVVLFRSILYVAMLHYSRKALLDYIDLKKLFTFAMESPIGAGLAAVAVSLMCMAISLVIIAGVLSR